MAHNNDMDSDRGGSHHSYGQSTAKSNSKAGTTKEFERPVSKLRPKAPITALDSETILEVAKKMANSRVDAALLLDADGALSGIITDNDVTRRVVSQFIDPTAAIINTVMTKGPKCVQTTDSALDALEMMVDNRFRHLPVMDEQGVVVGLLDIAKCLYDAISVLEKVHGDDAAAEAETDATAVMAQVMSAALLNAGGSKAANQAQLLIMQKMMAQMFEGGVPTLRTIIAEGRTDLPKVRHTTNIREACVIMTEHRKGLLVMDEDDELVGIITPKDILTRVIAADKSPDITAVSSVMTPNPDCVTAELTLLDALREMYEHKYLHLPVRDEDTGRVIGIVDVMELVCSTAGGKGGKGWRDFFSGAMAAGGDEMSEVASTISAASDKLLKNKPVPIRAKYLQPPETSSDVFSLSLDNRTGNAAVNGQYKYNSYDAASNAIARPAEFDFKVTDCSGLLHKIRCTVSSLSALRTAVAAKLSVSVEQLLLKYIDEEGDEVVISSDAALADAVDFARSSGGVSLKVTAVVDAAAAARITKAAEAVPAAVEAKAAPASDNTTMMLAIGGGVLAVVGIAAFVLTRKNK
jgi:CBS domain-containing protein